MIKGFRDFLMRGNVVDLAVGVIIGASFTGIVTSLVKDVITPVIGLATGGVDFSNHFLILKGTAVTTLADAQKAGDVTINYGLFLNALLNFVIVAAVIFLVIKLINAMKRKEAEAPSAPPAPSAEEKLLTEIRDLLAKQKV